MTTRPPSVQDTADVAESATIGPGTKIWHYAQVREDARLGADCDHRPRRVHRHPAS